jgi:OOP family OmpA-OmpF porin
MDLPIQGFVRCPRHRRHRLGAVSFSLLLGLLMGGSAGAQTIRGFALDRLEPAGAGSPWMTLEALDFDGHLRPTFSAVADWAWKPLVFYDPAGNELAALVHQQAVLRADAAMTLWNRARVDLSLPLVLVDEGSDVRIRALSYGAPSGPAVGDLRLGADVRLFGGPRDPVRAGAGALLFLPTGSTRQFSGDGGLRFWPRLALAGERRRLSWAARAGVHVRPKCGCDLAPGSELTLGAGVGWWASPRWSFGAELSGSKSVSGAAAFSQAAPPAELLVRTSVSLPPQWRASLGVAPGLSNGPGSPTVRFVLGVEYDMKPLTAHRPDDPVPEGPTNVR